MEKLEPIDQRARNRLKSAAIILYLMAVIDVLTMLAVARPSAATSEGPPPPVPRAVGFAWYGGWAVVCSATAFHLERRRNWARRAGMVTGLVHAVLLFFAGRLGLTAIISGVLGIMLVGSIHIASALEEVDPGGGGAG
jgi:hypothetical protein